MSKISQFDPLPGEAVDTDEVPVVRGPANFRATLAKLRDYILGDAELGNAAQGNDSGAAFNLLDSTGKFVAGVRADGAFIGSNYTLRPVVLERRFNGRSHLFVRIGGKLIQLTKGNHDNSAPEILQGGYIRFLSNRNGVAQLFIMGPAGQDQQPLSPVNFIDGIVVFGQSLAVANSEGQVTAPPNADARLRQLANSRAAATGPRVVLDGTRSATNETDPYEPGEINGIETLVDVVCPNANNAHLGQTVCTAGGQHLLKDHPAANFPDTNIGFSVIGHGGTTLANLGPGRHNWGNMRRAVEEWHKHAAAAGKRFDLKGIWLIHDHAHIAAGFTRAQQIAALQTFTAALVADLQTDSPYGRNLPVITSISGNASYSALAGTAAGNAICREVWQGTVEAAQLIANLFIACPMYFLATTDGVHPTAASYDWLGEFKAKVSRILWAGGEWTPTQFSRRRRHERNNNQLFVPVESMYPLQRNTTLVAQRPNDGFVFAEAGGIALSGPPIIDNVARGLIFPLTGAALSGPGQLYCASTSTVPTNAGQAPASAAATGCNICDTDPEIGARTGKPGYNWMLPNMLENIL